MAITAIMAVQCANVAVPNARPDVFLRSFQYLYPLVTWLIWFSKHGRRSIDIQILHVHKKLARVANL